MEKRERERERKVPLRSAAWFQGRDELGAQHRAVLRAMGIAADYYKDRPIIGIANSWSELNNCNAGLREVAAAVKRGVLAAGGLPLEFPTISLGEELTKPSAMLYRNLMAMDLEEMLRSNPIDGVVLLCNCDKTTPAQLMAAASANLPAIQVAGGPRTSSYWRGQEVGSGTDMWRVWDQVRTGELDLEAWHEFERCIGCSVGGCNVMGTASTMTGLSEALGMMLPGTSSIPATDALRLQAAEESGRAIVRLVLEDVRPRDIMTPAAFRNAIRVLFALGGSTNAVIHLIAIAGRLGIDLPLDLFDELARTTPFITDVKPGGSRLMAAFHAAGGIPAVMKQIRHLLHHECMTVAGVTVGEVIRAARCYDPDVIRPADRPVVPGPALAVLRGNLAPRGAVIKLSAASPALCQHEGRALVFESYDEMLAQIDRDDLDVRPDDVLVLKHAGPKGVPGMPEWGMIPIPRKLRQQGVTDMVRISDSRMSGTSFGTVVLHVAPEAAAGGPLAVVRTGDRIRLDVAGRRLDLLIDEAELRRRLAAWSPPPSPHLRGYPRLYIDHVLQADQGCDFDFLRPDSDEALYFVPPVVGRS